MPDLDEEIDSLLSEPRRERARRLVLDEVRVTPGEVRMGEGARVEYGREVDPDSPMEPPPKAPPAPITEQSRARQREAEDITRRRQLAGELQRSSVLEDLAQVATLGALGDGPGAARRMRERGRQLWDSITLGDARLGGRNPIAPIVGRDRRAEAPAIGLLQGLTLEHGDEIASALRGQPVDEVRREFATAEQQAPGLATGGRVAGTLALGAAIPGAGAGASTAARLGVAGVQGAGLGALAAHGASDGETPGERLADMPEGALAGGATGLLVGGVGEGLRAGAREARRIASGADRARVASVATGTSRELNDTLMREAESLPGGVPALAERLRRQRIVPISGTAQDVFESASRARDRLGAEIGRTYDALDESTRVPRQRILDALLEHVQQVERDPNRAQYAAPLLARVARYERTMPEELGYREAQRVLADLGEMTTWMDPASGRPNVPAELQRGAYRAYRGVLDDIAEEALARRAASQAAGPRAQVGGSMREPGAGGGAGAVRVDDEARRAAREALEQFRRRRLDWQAANFAQTWAERALDRLARNRGVSLTDYLAASGASSPQEWLMRVLGNRAWRQREGTLRATLADMLASGGGARLSEDAVRRAMPVLDASGRVGAAREGAEAVESERPEIAPARTELDDEIDALLEEM